MKRFLVLLAGLMLATGPSIALSEEGQTDLVHACKKKNGTIRLVAEGEACKRNETAVQWPGSLGALPVGLYDANGVLIGRVVGSVSEGVRVWINAEGASFGITFPLIFGALQPRGRVWFESSDCSGTPYLGTTGNPLPRTSSQTMWASQSGFTPSYQEVYRAPSLVGPGVRLDSSYASPTPLPSYPISFQVSGRST